MKHPGVANAVSFTEMRGLQEAERKIREARTIAVASHINPDGDSIGSLISLGLGLKGLGKHVYMLSPDGVPKAYRDLPGAGAVVRKTDCSVDLAVSVDTSAKDMLGISLRTFEKAAAVVEIDHHRFRERFGDIAFVDEKAAAVGELVYVLLRKLGAPLTKDIAQNILTSLIVETNSFRLPGTRGFTFRICAELMNTGVDFHKLTEMVYWSREKEAVILSGIGLSRCKFLKQGRLVWSLVRIADFQKYKGSGEDVDAVADEMRAIKGVQVAVLFREQSRKVLRVSLRSKGNFNVALLAARFGGGGHFDSAGCLIPSGVDSVRHFLREAEKCIG